MLIGIIESEAEIEKAFPEDVGHSDGINGLCVRDTINILNENEHRGCNRWTIFAGDEPMVTGASIQFTMFEAKAIATRYCGDY